MSKRLPGPVQLGFVVPSVDDAAKVWWENYGVGPWRIWNLGPGTIDDPEIDGSPSEYSMRLAIANWGEMEVELLEPLDQHSIYAQSLAAHGGKPHLHHVLARPIDYAAAVGEFADRGYAPTMGGRIAGETFHYFGTEDEVGTVIELGHLPEEVEYLDIPVKEETYPEGLWAT
jgi:methylmalonyl-CoA/ethylmalonyl-CoA epimerase